MTVKTIPAVEPPDEGRSRSGKTVPSKPVKATGCPHFFDGRCKILDADVEELGKAAENYDEAAEDHAEGGEST